MDTLLNDLLHADPTALLILVGLIFLTIAVIGSFKTYFDPGKGGRIAAGVLGAVLLTIGLMKYKPQAPPTVPAEEAVAKSKAAPAENSRVPAHSTHAEKSDVQARNTHSGNVTAEALSVSSSPTANSCYVPGRWPHEIHTPLQVGDSCTVPSGETGRAIVANSACTYNSGPLSGTTAQFNHLMYVGFACQSRDHGSKGTVLAAIAAH